MECLHLQTELSTTKIILQNFEKVEMCVWCCTVMCYMGAEVELVHGNEMDQGRGKYNGILQSWNPHLLHSVK